MLESALSDNEVRIVPFDAVDSRVLQRMLVELRLEPETFPYPMRFDLMICATAIRHARILVTDNSRDFRRFNCQEYWATSESFCANPNLRAPEL